MHLKKKSKTLRPIFETEGTIMTKMYFTIVGTGHYYGQEFLEPGMRVILKKDPHNEYDNEAIMVNLEGLGKIGYVANSPYTVQGDSLSAGRLYDKIGDVAFGKIMYVLPKGVLCTLDKKSLRKRKEERLSYKEYDVDDYDEKECDAFDTEDCDSYETVSDTIDFLEGLSCKLRGTKKDRRYR